MRREWIEMVVEVTMIDFQGSPSMRREWIEILDGLAESINETVSLHAEGVD